MAKNRDTKHLLQLLDSQQFFQAFTFSASRPRLCRLWQREQQHRSFRLDLSKMATHFRKEARSGELPPIIMVLLRSQSREICDLSQSEDIQTRRFALEILLRQPLLQYRQEISAKEKELFLYSPEPVAISEQTAKSYPDSDRKPLKTHPLSPLRFIANRPAEKPENATSNRTRTKPQEPYAKHLTALQNELQKIFPYLLSALDAPEYQIRQRFITELAQVFPHKLGQKQDRLIIAEERKLFSWQNPGEKATDIADTPDFWNELRLHLYQKLLYCGLNDSVYSIRCAAMRAIRNHFIDLFQLRRHDLDWKQQRYFVETFHISSAYQKKLAWEILRNVQAHTAPDAQPDAQTMDGQDAAQEAERKLLEIKLFHYLDVSGELFSVMADCVRQAPQINIRFWERQVLESEEEPCERIESEFLWNTQILFRALDLKHTRFSQLESLFRKMSGAEPMNRGYVAPKSAAEPSDNTARKLHKPVLKPEDPEPELWNGEKLEQFYNDKWGGSGIEGQNLSGAWPTLQWHLENLDGYTWIFLFELFSYGQSSLELPGRFLLRQIAKFLPTGQSRPQFFQAPPSPQSHGHWADILRLFSELICEQEMLQKKGYNLPKVFAWLKLRSRYFMLELDALWQGTPRKAQNYSRQFGMMLALSAWKLCVSYHPLSGKYLNEYVTEICALAAQRDSGPIFVMLLLAMPAPNAALADTPALPAANIFSNERL
ncbi:MAG: hypothetical protein AAF975_04480, partial [Spirochaetota bacterium]